ncbi:MAG: glycosyltransferase family 2 protein [Clostridiales bacterium]|jgi:glycosyltransferase involved in cell wall biosynthesis|nr:glycosyltransferase family 2 protein [Clostridiales bacterium]
MAIELSLCMIVKNEGKNLCNCLDSVKGVFDEINIVDTGSIDNTVELAKRYTDRVFYYEWEDDFAGARNFSFSKATKEYIMWLDADDIVTQENVKKLLKLKKGLSRDIQYVMMYYYYNIDENGNSLLTQKRERILKRSAGFSWVSPVHEYVDVSGKGLSADIFISHNHRELSKRSMERNFRILEKLIKLGNRDKRIIKYYAQSFSDEKDLDKNLKYINLFIEMNKEDSIVDPSIYLKAYEIYATKKDYENAFKVLKESEGLLGNTSEYQCILGCYYWDVKKDKEKSLECFYRALGCTGETLIVRDEGYYYFKPNFFLGRVYLSNKGYQPAYEFFKKAYSFRQYDELNEIVKKIERYIGLSKKL